MDRDPLDRHPPLGRYPHWQTPPRQIHPPKQTPPQAVNPPPPNTDTQAAGMHSTEMHSC